MSLGFREVRSSNQGQEYTFELSIRRTHGKILTLFADNTESTI